MNPSAGERKTPGTWIEFNIGEFLEPSQRKASGPDARSQGQMLEVGHISVLRHDV